MVINGNWLADIDEMIIQNQFLYWSPNVLLNHAVCFFFMLRLQPTRERVVLAEWLLGNVSGFTQPGPSNMRWRKRLSLRFRGPTWEM